MGESKGKGAVVVVNVVLRGVNGHDAAACGNRSAECGGAAVGADALLVELVAYALLVNYGDALAALVPEDFEVGVEAGARRGVEGCGEFAIDQGGLAFVYSAY